MGRRRAGVAAALGVTLVVAAACANGDKRAGGDSATAARNDTTASGGAASGGGACGDNAGLKLPAGFCATIFADNVGGARHIAVAPNGDVFVQLISAKKDAESGSGMTGGVL
ncbi:MAG TPA: hypothetical protein VFJ74_02380, partial [Gemmatimonadaceae bacterium]|nr:hypothetical protein [Gemmatimonadaceae bacterium]